MLWYCCFFNYYFFNSLAILFSFHSKMTAQPKNNCCRSHVNCMQGQRLVLLMWAPLLSGHFQTWANFKSNLNHAVIPCLEIWVHGNYFCFLFFLTSTITTLNTSSSPIHQVKDSLIWEYEKLFGNSFSDFMKHRGAENWRF